MNILTFFAVLKSRFLVVLWSILVVTIIAAIVGYSLPQNYEAWAKVQVDSHRENILTGAVEGKDRVSEFLGQQSAIVTSRTVALEVVDELVESGHLVLAEFEERWIEKTGGDIVPGNDLLQWTADKIMEKLEIQSNGLESSITIFYRSHDPSISARYANAFADAYMRVVLQERKRRASRNAASFSEETRVLEKQVENARAELTQFQQESGIVTIGAQQLESAEVELGSLTNRHAEARADNAEAQSLLEQVHTTPRGELISIPIPQNNSPGRTAQSRLAAIEAKLKRVADRYGETHPDFIEAVRERQAQQEVIFNTIKERAEYTQRRVDKLNFEVETQKRNVVNLQKTRQHFNTLENNLRTNEATYTQIALRTQEEGLQARVAAVEVLLLARAIPPESAVTPAFVVILVAGIILGVGMGTSIAVLVELLEGKLRSKEALLQAVRAPVFAEIKVVKPAKVKQTTRTKKSRKVKIPHPNRRHVA